MPGTVLPIKTFDDLYLAVANKEFQNVVGYYDPQELVVFMDIARSHHYNGVDRNRTAYLTEQVLPSQIRSHFLRLLDSEKPDTNDWEQLLLSKQYIGPDLGWPFPAKGENPRVNEGFKLHLSTYPFNGRDILTDVYPVLQQVPHKVMRNKLMLKRFENHPTQRGKFITIYPTTPQESVEVARELDARLSERGYAGPIVPSDKSLPNGRSGLVYYRYGTFLVEDDNDHGKITDSSGRKIDDVRSTDGSLAVPSWVEDPFLRL